MQTYSNNIYDCRHIILSGGGTKGFAYIGLTKILKEYEIYDKLETILGFSVGSIFSIALLLKMNYQELTDIVLKTNFFNSLINIETNDVLNFTHNKGLINGDKIKKFIKEIIKIKTDREDMTFLESYQLTNIVLGISVTNLTTKQLNLITYKTDPELSIADAVVMSCSIPLLFEPYKYNNCLYVDGDMAIDCKNNPRFFKEIYDIDTEINSKYNIMLEEVKKDTENEQKDTENEQKDPENEQKDPENTKNNLVDSHNTYNTYNFMIKHKDSIRKTIEEELISNYFSKTLTLYLKKELKIYTCENIDVSTLTEYITLLYDASYKIAYNNTYQYPNCNIDIYLPNQLGSFMNFKLENEDIVNSIDIGYNIIKKTIENSKTLNL